MSEDGSPKNNLRDFRKQKKHNQANGSNEDVNTTSDSSPSNTPEIVKSVRRRIVRISDSDSDVDNPAPKNDSSPATKLIQKPFNTYRPKKSDLVIEREKQVKYLINMYPKVETFEIYNLLSKVDFDIKDACKELNKNMKCIEKFVDYNTWNDKELNGQNNDKASSPVDEQQPHNKKRDRHEKRNKQSKSKRRRVDHDDDSNDSTKDHYKLKRVYDSDEDSDVEVSDELTGDKKRVMEFLQNATPGELSLMSCSKKKIDALLLVRPFGGWIDLVKKLQQTKHLSADLLNAAQRVLQTRNNIKALMRKCTNIATQLEHAIKGSSGIKMQPSILSTQMKLTNYQMVGLNWLDVLHQQGLNGILADEMGLGKTVQVIAFLAHLKETKAATTTHLIIVPASTLENWQNEFTRWCPELRVLLYYGSLEERRGYRIMFSQGKHRDFDVILTTYAMVGSSPEEKKMFRVTPMHYVVFDEAHMLKNMNTQRYETLTRIKAGKRILLTGTPLQNNLLELMSLLTFVMPNIFAEKSEDLKMLFQKNGKKDKDDDLPVFEKNQIEQAKRIMKPFVLRRLKRDVLQDLPKKTDVKLDIDMVDTQQIQYKELVTSFTEAQNEVNSGYNGMSMMSDLRKLSNHPLLLRYHYRYEQLPELAKRLAADSKYKDTVEKFIVSDLACMSDFQIHTMCQEYLCLKKFSLPEELILISGKFTYLDKKLAELKRDGHRVLIFSQYVIMLNVMEEYVKLRNHSYLRLDGATPVPIRQQLIDEFTEDTTIFLFLLSTKAGGLGINLTAADTVIIHDIDFNPYNDKQAEDRCHRMGQTKPVNVFRLISKGTIEEGMWELTQEKLKLEQEITNDDYENTDIKSVVRLLSTALGIDTKKATNLVSPIKNGL